MSGFVGVGIVGAGAIFDQHALALSALDGRARLLAVCDVDDTKLRAAASAHRVAMVCRDFAALLDRPDVDLVAVCTPPAFHEEAVVGALRAGKHVVCEKPLAPTLAAADRIIAVAREHPGRLSVVHQFRYLPAVRRTLWVRDAGELGSLLFGRFHRFARFRRPGRAARAPWWGSWDIAGGGTVMTQLIHELDLACLLFGPAAQVTAVADTLNEEIESEDTCASVVRFGSGAIVTCQSTMCAHRSRAGFDVIGTCGSAHSPWAFECLDHAHREQVRTAALAAVPDSDATASAHAPYLADVLDAVEAGRALPSGPTEARRSLELATAIYAASVSGEPVTLPIGPSLPCYGGITRADYEGRPSRRLEVSVAA
jgi:UDP-N-acetyl-2-amino-2-deoxyglucuronate dehydrogenase